MKRFDIATVASYYIAMVILILVPQGWQESHIDGHIQYEPRTKC